jgi:hypothetical protein
MGVGGYGAEVGIRSHVEDLYLAMKFPHWAICNKNAVAQELAQSIVNGFALDIVFKIVFEYMLNTRWLCKKEQATANDSNFRHLHSPRASTV